MMAEAQLMDKNGRWPQRWMDEEFLPVLELIEEAGLQGEDETAGDAYMRGRGGAVPADPRARGGPARS